MALLRRKSLVARSQGGKGRAHTPSTTTLKMLKSEGVVGR